MPNEPLDTLRMGLEHARAVFVYHAGQRISSINFYVAVQAAFVAAFAAFIARLPSEHPPLLVPLVASILGGASIATAVVFYFLDWRNHTLVDVDEQALLVLEKRLREAVESIIPGSSLPQMEIIKRSEEVNPKRLRYRLLVPSILFVFGFVSSAAVAGSWIYWCAEACRKAEPQAVAPPTTTTAPSVSVPANP